MVLKGQSHGKPIKADIIILGRTLPGIVTAHKLKSTFGNTLDIVVLDLASSARNISKFNVAFQQDVNSDEEETTHCDATKQLRDNEARYYLAKFTREFKMPLPDVLFAPQKVKTPLNKLFQHRNGKTVECLTDFHDFDYLSYLEKFELNQYQNLLDVSMRDLFQTKKADTIADRRRLLYYDLTNMDQHIRSALLFPTSREIMRTTVRLVCGAPANVVSVLFYLHQCYRTSSSRNQLDGDNTRFREKLLGYCRQRLAVKLQQSVADITLSAKSIKEIRTYSAEQVILKTIKGDTSYVCNLLAMALRPDQLSKIQVEEKLLSSSQVDKTNFMIPGHAKKFLVQYEEGFWRDQGYSGDILSVQGPIVWAMEQPRLSTTGSSEKYFSLIGYLMVRDDDNADSKEAVLEQLVKLFGEEAATPISYKETDISDVFIPRCGDFVALRQLTGERIPKYLEWGALDVFADGDVAAALQAGHTAYLNLLTCLRPQAQTYEDRSIVSSPIILRSNPLDNWLASINVVTSMNVLMYTAAIYMGFCLFNSYMRK